MATNLRLNDGDESQQKTKAAPAGAQVAVGGGLGQRRDGGRQTPKSESVSRGGASDPQVITQD